MTELLLKNKKLLNDNIINFIYKNEDLSFENIDVITIFNNNPNIQLNSVDLDDKVILYEFYIDHEEDKNLLIDIINDFTQFIIFLNNNKNNSKISDKISGKKEISEFFEFLNDIKLSDDFKGIFEEKKTLTIDKITNLFIYYLRLIFDKIIKDDFNDYQIQLEDIDQKKKDNITKYFNEKNKDLLIGRETFRNALRLLISLYLYKEKEKEEKIKKNTNNVVNYLNIKDIWLNILTNKNEFKEELKEIKKLKIQINQILAIYDLLKDEEDKDDKFYDDVNNEIKKRKEEAKKSKDDGNEEEKEIDEEKNEEEEEKEVEEEKEEEEEQIEQIEEVEDDVGNRD